MKKIYIILFAFIFLLGVILRFYKLGQIPNSLNWDEASWGYNAYSILKTGHDEHGAFIPLSFEAFGDFKQPVYVYLTSLAIGVFGLTSFAVRFPSAFLGILTIPFVWLFVFELFRKEKYRYKLALCAMFFFAISPWSVQFSRVAFEANVGLFFVTAGVALFLRGLNTKKYLLSYFSILFLSISGYSYHSEKLFTPMLFAGLLLFSYFIFKVSKKYILIFLFLFILGNSLWIVDSRTTARGRSVTFLSNQTQVLQNSTEKIIYDNAQSDKLGLFLHNRRIVYINRYFENYLSHFDLNYLFVSGDNARHHTFGMGVLYLVSLPLILIGLVVINKRKYWFIFLWFLLAPAASALAVDAPNASRSLIFLPTWQVFEAVGLLFIFSIKKSVIKSLLLFIVPLFIFINFTYYIHNYFSHTNSEYGIYWQYGYEDAVKAVQEYRNTNKKVIFSDKYEQPYIFYLFYTSYNPSKYIASGGSDRIKNSCFAIDNVYFGKCASKLSSGDIFLSQGAESGGKLKKIRDIESVDKKVVGEIYESL